MSLEDLVGIIGRMGIMPIEGGELRIKVEVRDVKKAYGNVLYEVKPIEGTGSKWVKAERVHLIE